MRKKVWIWCLVVGMQGFPGYSQSLKSQWVDSIFSTIDLPAKIGQILMVPINSYDEDALDKASTLIKKHKIGGVVFTKGGPVTQANLTNQIQRLSEIPLLIGMSAEEGLGATLDSTIQFPPPIMLGSIKNDTLLFLLGREIGRQLNKLGVHINFSPTANLSTTLQNEALLYNSLGENKDIVASKATTYHRGLYSMNVFSIAKHFPDYGIRVQGFQKGIPVIKTQEDPNRLYPLQKLFENDCRGVLTAYEQDLIFPNRRKRIVQTKKAVSKALPNLYSGEYLKQQLNFKGLVFSFIPDIHELNKKFGPGTSELFAFQAGNDVLLFPQHVGAAIRKLKRNIRKNKMLQKQLDESVKKILSLKYDAGLATITPLQTDQLNALLNTSFASSLKQEIIQKSVTVVKDEHGMLPIKQLESNSFASISIGAEKGNAFTSVISQYAAFNHYQLRLREDTINMASTLSKHNVLVAAIFPEASELEGEYVALLKKVSEHTTVIVVEFGSPTKISLIESLPCIVQGHSDEIQNQKFVAQLLFGAADASATLPFTINETLKQGTGISIHAIGRLGYASPEEMGIGSKTLNQISLIAQEAINQKATPGCQIIVARKGKIVYEKSFGSQTYNNSTAIDGDAIYDLASITKVAATLQVTMFLHERGLLDIYKKASYYLPELLKSNKKDVIIKDILTHQAGLTPFVPFWINTVKNSLFMPEYYSLVKTEEYPWQVAPNLYAVKSLKDSLWSWSIQSKMRDKPARTPYSFVYSDVGLYILHHLNEKLLNQPQEEFLQQNLYEPLGAVTMGYLPLERFDTGRIVPTENDQVFRKSLLLGTVHDEGAAMLGGVAGHAGLFSNALDLAKLGQLFLQKGYYGGQQYFKPETVSYFTNKQFDTSRRGLGWDKPVQSEWNSPTSIFASPETYGHTGFTGTCLWIDPKFDLVFVFLSNRVYPDRSNTKLYTLNIRSRIQDVIYRSIFAYDQYGNTPQNSYQFIKN